MLLGWSVVKGLLKLWPCTLVFCFAFWYGLQLLVSCCGFGLWFCSYCLVVRLVAVVVGWWLVAYLYWVWGGLIQLCQLCCFVVWLVCWGCYACILVFGLVVIRW